MLKGMPRATTKPSTRKPTGFYNTAIHTHLHAYTYTHTPTHARTQIHRTKKERGKTKLGSHSLASSLSK